MSCSDNRPKESSVGLNAEGRSSILESPINKGLLQEPSRSSYSCRDGSASFASTSPTSRIPSTAKTEVEKETEAYDDVPLSEALAPDTRYANDFFVKNNKFAFSPGQLNKMINPKSLAAFTVLGGLEGLVHGLRSDLSTGLSLDEASLPGRVSVEGVSHTSFDDLTSGGSLASFVEGTPYCDRIRVFGKNKLPDQKSNGFFRLFWWAYKDKIIILLTIAAVVSLALGVYEALSGGPKVSWIEGVAICVAILIVTVVTAANDWQKERQFAKLNRRKDDRQVTVIRSGREHLIHVTNVLVGDLMRLEPGDSPAADGILVSGHGIKCDESSATGESDQMKKTTGQEVWRRIKDGTATRKLDPFIISGSRVLEGVGNYLVTSVGTFSCHGRIMESLQVADEPTPLQVKLGRLADWIGWLGMSSAAILFLVLFARFLAHLPNNPASPAEKGQEFMDVLIIAVTVIVVAIPEGLPLAVTLALAFATTRMVKENNLVRVLRACETMGNATVICSDKTGTLTQNKMTVVAAAWSFNEDSPDAEKHTSLEDDISGAFKRLSAASKNLIVKSIALNSTAFEEEKDGKREFVGSKTEVALLRLAKDYLGMDTREERANVEIVQMFPFESSRKCMGVVYRESPSVGYRLFVKGAAEMLLNCANSAVRSQAGRPLATVSITEDQRQDIHRSINGYAEQSLRTIGMVYKDLPCWPPASEQLMENDTSEPDFESLLRDMTWIGVVGIQDPLRPEVPDAIKTCNSAGVQVKMVSGDNLKTATAIAAACGILTDGIVMEGPTFRQLSDPDLDEVAPRLQVLARSSPDDKRVLVERLKRLGETVAVTGDGTNDGPALKTADIGFSMGIAGTEVAKEASSIILLDDNFKSIITALAWGRAVNDAVSKFLQFQITVNITAVILTSVSAIHSGSNESVLTAVQLLWVNLIMDTFAALALATDGPNDKILQRKPVPKSATLFTMNMWKMIIGQSIYKLVVILTLYFAGHDILRSILDADKSQLQLDTIIFNTFVWMQIFNELNSRRLDNHLNIFEGISKNYWFMGINCIIIGGQILIIFVGGVAIGVTPLNGIQWSVCLICAVVTLPVGVLLRFLPDDYFAVVFNLTVDGFTLLLRPIAKTFGVIVRFFKAVMRPYPRKSRPGADGLV